MRPIRPPAVTLLLLGAALVGVPAVHAQENAQGAPEMPKAEGAPEAPKAEGAPGLPLYNAAHRRDPFRPFMLDIRPDRVPLTPLQRYELGQLSVVATVWDVSPLRAMVEDSSGMGYIVGLGTPIGRSGGVVAAIEPQRIIVEERVLDYYGKEQINRIVMETPKEEGPNQAARERQ